MERWAELSDRQEEEMERGLSASIDEWRRSGLVWNQGGTEGGDVVSPISVISLHKGSIACENRIVFLRFCLCLEREEALSSLFPGVGGTSLLFGLGSPQKESSFQSE